VACGGNKMRIFIALKTTPYEDELFKIVSNLKTKIHGDVKWVEKDNLHVTVKFLGEVEEPFLEDIFRISDEISSLFKTFNFEIQGISGFPKKEFARVLFFAINDVNRNIENIMRELDKSFEKYHFKREESYVPHITFGRCRTNYLNLSEFKFEDFSFSVGAFGITVFESVLTKNGPIYNEVKTFNFKD
jgi:2'-5' RNA ligase